MENLLNIKAINDFILEKGWSSYKFSRELDLDYSFVYRVLKGDVNGGNKFITRLIRFCNENKIDHSDFIFFNSPLSIDNKLSKKSAV